MQNLEIAGAHDTFFTPQINFNAVTGELKISGESYLEDTISFYNNLKNWISDYIRDVGKAIKLDIDLSYFNTSSSKALLELFVLVKQYENQGGQVEVVWTVNWGDSEMKEEIEDFALDSKLDIKVIESNQV